MSDVYREIDLSDEPGTTALYCWPAVRRNTFRVSPQQLNQLHAIFRFQDTLTLGQSAMPALRAAATVSEEPFWWALMAELERGPIVLSRTGGWVWEAPEDAD